jgi:hypothetical protein
VRHVTGRSLDGPDHFTGGELLGNDHQRLLPLFARLELYLDDRQAVDVGHLITRLGLGPIPRHRAPHTVKLEIELGARDLDGGERQRWGRYHRRRRYR